jgi:hypothetical protein
MDTFDVIWKTDGKNRAGFVAFKTDGNLVGVVNIYAVYETPFRTVIGAEHDTENIYESTYNGSVDEAKNELVEKAVEFYEGYSLKEWISEALIMDAEEYENSRRL